MNILAGILLIAATLASFLTLVLDSDFAMTIHIIKGIVNLVAIIIVFYISAPIWIGIVAILGTIMGFVAGLLGVKGSCHVYISLTLLIVGMLCTFLSGVELFL